MADAPTGPFAGGAPKPSLSGGAIAGIVIAVVVAVALIVVFVVLYTKCKHKSDKAAHASAALASDLAQTQLAQTQLAAANRASAAARQQANSSGGRSGAGAGSGSSAPQSGMQAAAASRAAAQRRDPGAVEGQHARAPGQAAEAAAAARPATLSAQDASLAARTASVSKGFAAERRSEILARDKNGCGPRKSRRRAAAAGKSAPGAGGRIRQLDADVAASAARAGTRDLTDGTGKLPQVVAKTNGPSNVHMAPTAIRGGNVHTDFTDSGSQHALLDPEGNAKLNRAMSLSGTPALFHANDADQNKHKRNEIFKAMMLNGRVDPDVDDVLSASAPFVATSNMLRRAVQAQNAVDRETIIQTPLRFLYQSPLYRPTVPTPPISPVVGDNITPGQAYFLQSVACANQGQPVTQESY